MSPRFPVAFRPPAFASWASCPAEEFRSPHGRPTRHSPGPRRGFHVPHIRATAGLGALFTSRPSGALATGPIPPATACPLSQGPGPITRSSSHPPELSITRRHRGFTRVHPPDRPQRLVVPRMEQGPLGHSPGFAPRQARPAAHAGAGDGHRALARSHMTDIVGPPIHELTQNVRPRVARSAWTCPGSRPRRTWPPGPDCVPATTNPRGNTKPAGPAKATPRSAPSSPSAPGPPAAPAPTSAPSSDACTTGSSRVIHSLAVSVPSTSGNKRGGRPLGGPVDPRPVMAGV